MTRKTQQPKQDASVKFCEQQKYAKELCQDLMNRIDNYKTGNKVHWGHVGDFGYLIKELEDVNQTFASGQ